MKKRVLYNIVLPLILQLVTIAVNLVIPRLFILQYGSQANGLLSTALQISQALYLLEGGVAVATAAQLYLPMREKNWDEVSKVMSSARKYYGRIAWVFSGLVLVAAIGLSVYLKDEVSMDRTIMLVLITSSQSLFTFTVLGRINIVQVADGRAYIKNANAIIGRLIGFLLQYILISQRVDYLLVKLADVTCVLIATTPAVVIYLKEYQHVNHRHPDPTPIRAQSSALLLQLTQLGSRSLPALLSVLLFNLNAASVISVYVVIFHFGNSVIEMISQALASSFNRIYQGTSIEQTRAQNKLLTYIVWFISGLLFISFMKLTYPFVKIYTRGADIDYVLPYAVFFLSVTEAFRNLCFVPKTAFLALGKLEVLSKTSVYELLIGVIGGIIGGKTIGLPGVMLGMLIGSCLRYLYLTHSFYREVMHLQANQVLMDNLLDLLAVIVAFFSVSWYGVPERGVVSWTLGSILFVVITASMLLLAMLLFRYEASMKVLAQMRNVLICRKREGV